MKITLTIHAVSISLREISSHTNGKRQQIRALFGPPYFAYFGRFTAFFRRSRVIYPILSLKFPRGSQNPRKMRLFVAICQMEKKLMKRLAANCHPIILRNS